MEIQDAKQARPHCELIAELLDSRQPKTEREHAAVREIERLRAELAEAKRDAERYRWWRRFFVPDAPLLPDAVAEAYTGEELDAAAEITGG